jgi:16S rRNA (cytosine967-C5)-methyltransferase
LESIIPARLVKDMNPVSARSLALSVLNRLKNSPGMAEKYLENAFLKAPHLTDRDRAFTVHIVQGVIRFKLRLDWIIAQTAHLPIKKIDPLILNVLRIALYQIFFMDRVPQSAAVNEAVKQARYKHRKVAGFVNGLLRQVCRQKEHLSFPDRKKDAAHYLSTFYSYPRWLVDKWTAELGIDSAERLLAAGNQIPCLIVRANRLKITRSGLIESLKAEGVRSKPTDYSPEGVEIKGLRGPVTSLKAFQEGSFQVQGEAAQVVSHLIIPEQEESILDVCAGLGGKSTHLAELLQDNASIVSVDLNSVRLAELSRSARRLGIEGLKPVIADFSRPYAPFFDGCFQKILIDGPCSGLGVLSKHPDGKWARDEKDIKRLAGLQARLLNHSVRLLSRGGKLLYVTCTISKQENENVVKSFLDRNREMALEDLNQHAPRWCRDLIDTKGFFRSLPHVHKMDGFFGALFSKKAD